jgi:phenylpropionate dioxygenase-like ring-hydroxylating dioxygenase large terminal subunit
MQPFESASSTGGMNAADDARAAPDAALLGEWLPVCNSADVPAGQSRGFVVAGERLVVWRNASEDQDSAAQPDISTDVHVWRDHCPHRGAQLSLGSVTGGLIACPYHGWRYDADGQCIHIPANPSIRPAKRACARTYRVEEKYGVVWTCLGEPSRPLDFFPEYAEYDMPGARRINLAAQTVRSSAPRVVENFLDMAHFPFVHTGILGDASHAEVQDYEVIETEDGLEARQCRFWQPAGLPGQEGVDIEYVYRVKRPLVASLSKVAQHGAGALHLLLVASPVSETETRAWLVSVFEDEAAHSDQALYDFNMQILMQDTPIVESQWPKRLPLDPQAELHQVCDRLSVGYRGYLRERGWGYGTELGGG